jgi:hypothetical protein
MVSKHSCTLVSWHENSMAGAGMRQRGELRLDGPLLLQKREGTWDPGVDL